MWPPTKACSLDAFPYAYLLARSHLKRTQVCTGLFSYLNGIAIPWRVSILCHHLSKRSSEPGYDFYGRETEAIWFHIPERSRAIISICLCLSVTMHFATQATRFVWLDYKGSNDPSDGMIPVNVTFVLSIVFAIAGGVVQGTQEKKLMALHPERYPPGLGKAAKDVYLAWRRGELKLCSLKAIREISRITKEEKAKHHLASQLQRMTTESVMLQKKKRAGPPNSPAVPSLGGAAAEGTDANANLATLDDSPSTAFKGSPKGSVTFSDGSVPAKSTTGGSQDQ